MVNKVENFSYNYSNHAINQITKTSQRLPFAEDTLKQGNAEGQGQCGGWCSRLYSVYVDWYIFCKTRYMRFKGWLGWGPNFAIPFHHPSKAQIQDLSKMGDGLYPKTLDHMFCLLRNKHKHIHIDTSFVYNLTPPHALSPALLKKAPPGTQQIFIPLFIQFPGGNHFTVLCVDLTRQRVEYNDSEGRGLTQPFLNAVLNYYFPRNANAKLLVNDIRAQWDMHSCGIHVVDFIKRRAEGDSFKKITQNPTSTWAIEDLRVEFIKKLLYAGPWTLKQLRNL